MHLNSLMTRSPETLGSGNHVDPEGVSDIDPGGGPSIEDLRKANEELQKQLQSQKAREDQYLAALAEKDVRRAPPKAAPAADDEEPLDPVTLKHLEKVRGEFRVQLSQVQDQHDEMSFLQYAASMGLPSDDVAATMKLYGDYRQSGVRVKDNDGNERPMTRADVLYQVLGRKQAQEQFKAAPQRNLESLRSKMLGAAGFDGVGAQPDGPRFVKLDAELDKEPTKARVSKLEKALSKIEF